MTDILKKIASSRVVAIIAFSFTVISFYLYVFFDAGGRWIACDTLYPEAIYWNCASLVDDNFELILTSVGVLSFTAGIVVLLVRSLNQSSKKQVYLRFYKRYAVLLGLCIGVGLVPIPFCLGFLGCTTIFLFPVTVPFAIIVIVVSILFIAMANNKISFLRIFSVTIITGILLMVAGLSVLDWVDDAATPNRMLRSSAVNLDDITLCKQAKTTMNRDKCMSSVAISKRDASICQNLIRESEKNMCEALILRNTAIDALDISMCNSIKIGQQRSVCRQHITESLN